jgi:Immunoglobulin I-set domain
VRIEPDRQTISQGTSAELRCLAVGDPTPTTRWTKVGEEFSSNIQVSCHSVLPKWIIHGNCCEMHQVTGPVLRIINAVVRDRGMYICSAENPGGVAQASAIVEVERESTSPFTPSPEFSP